MKVITKLKPVTPYELFRLQVQGMYDNLRYNKNKSYVPAQFGGLNGQRAVIEEEMVVNVTDFEG